MSQLQEHERVVERYLTAFKESDLDAIVEITHPECVVSEPESLPYGGEYTGKQAFKEVFGNVLSTWDEVVFDMNDVVGDGAVFTILGDVRLESDGVGSIETQVVEVCEVEDGLIRGLTIYYQDTAAILDLLE
jgi:ketosteroid isomerase-like protein